MDFLHWLKAGNHKQDNNLRAINNGTCNAYLEDVFRFYLFVEAEYEEFGSLKVLSYNYHRTANAVGVQKKLRYQSFKGYLKAEERNVRPAEHEEIISIPFIPYRPDQTIAKEFDSVRHKLNMVWDFARPCSQRVKEQIFITLNAMIDSFKEPRGREKKLSGLQYLYDFCAENEIADIDMLLEEQVQAFEDYLDRHTTSENRKQQLLPSLNFCRRTAFMQNEEIHWDANVWYLERLNLPKSRVNPSASFHSVSFMEITDAENRRYAKEYLKYQMGITGQSVSTIVTKFGCIKNFLIWLCSNNENVCDCTAERIDSYLKELQEQEIIAKTFNEYLTGIAQFFRFLVVRGYMKKVPFRTEYYQQKIIPKHHDRSVSPEVCEEMLSKLHLLPEHLRCMYLHLWTLGLRISEVCMLKGNAYYRQEPDAWIQVYQIKMKNYKRIPISGGLYKIMQVYIKRHNIGPDDYLFTNKNGGAYRTGTSRQQPCSLFEERRKK